MKMDYIYTLEHGRVEDLRTRLARHLIGKHTKNCKYYNVDFIGYKCLYSNTTFNTPLWKLNRLAYEKESQGRLRWKGGDK